jgi:hypothetical protein
MSRNRFWLMLAIACTVLQFDSQDRTLDAQEAVHSEYQLKALYLYNFAKFVEWPPESFPEPNAPLVIGVVGEDPFGPYLEEAVRNKTIGPHSFVVRHVRVSGDARKCHILFISNSERRRLTDLLNGIRGVPVLTVCDLDRFLESGGIIRFYMEGKKVRFQINNDAAKHCDLKISSKLLQLGTREKEQKK